MWFNRKAKEISWKLVRYVNDGKGNYEMLSSFSQDIKERVFEYVEKVNKKIGLTFLELVMTVMYIYFFLWANLLNNFIA